jgi:hypothetical protein
LRSAGLWKTWLVSESYFGEDAMRGLTLIPLAALLLMPLTASAAVGWADRSGRAAPQSTVPVQFTVVDTVTGRTSRGSIGTFTASGLVCPSGTFADVEATIGINTERTCDDGSGAFDSNVRPGRGANPWLLTPGGTGRYTSLRGRGDCLVSSGPPIVRTCQFLGAFDDVAPSATVSRFTVSPASKHMYAVRTSFTARDDVMGNAVLFRLSIRAGARALAKRTGTTTGEAKSFGLRVKPPRAARRLTLTLSLVDPVGNTRTIRRTRQLPHRLLS